MVDKSTEKYNAKAKFNKFRKSLVLMLKRTKYRLIKFKCIGVIILWHRTFYFVWSYRKIIGYCSYFFITGYVIWILYPNIKNEELDNFLFNSGTVIGGTLAILFTFYTLIVTFSNDKYPPELYRIIGRERKLDFIYLMMGVLTILQFTLGIIYSEKNFEQGKVIAAAGLFILSLSFVLLYQALLLVRSRMDPKEGLGRVYKIANDVLSKVKKDADKWIMAEKINPDYDQSQIKLLPVEIHYKSMSNFNFVSKILMYLYDYHESLFMNGSKRHANDVMLTIGKLSVKYVDTKKDSIISVKDASNPLELTSLDQHFFEKQLNSLTSACQLCISNDDSEGLRHIIDVWCNIAAVLATIDTDSESLRGRYNPELRRSVYYYLDLSASKQITENDDIAFRVIDGLVRLATVCTNINDESMLKLVLAEINRYDEHALKNQNVPLHIQALSSASNIYVNTIDRTPPKGTFLQYVNHEFSRLTVNHIKLNKQYVSLDITSSYAITPLDYALLVLVNNIKSASNYTNNSRIHDQDKILNSIENGLSFIELVSKKITLLDTSVLIHIETTLDQIFSILLTLINKRPWGGNQDKIIELLRRLINFHGRYIRTITSVEYGYYDEYIQRLLKRQKALVQNDLLVVVENGTTSFAINIGKLIHDKDINRNILPRWIAAYSVIGPYMLSKDCVDEAKSLAKLIADSNENLNRIYQNSGLTMRGDQWNKVFRNVKETLYPEFNYEYGLSSQDIKNELHPLILNPDDKKLFMSMIRHYINLT